MGYSLSWLAVKGLGKGAVYDRLALAAAGAGAKRKRDSGQGRELPDGWVLVVLPRVEHPLLAGTRLASLSTGCTALACNVDEHVMFSSSEQWTNGQRLWRLQHQGDKDFENLGVLGDPPDGFSEIEKDCRHRQATDTEKPPVDFIFEVPLLTAKSITTFKHDESDWQGFEALQWLAAKPWWRFW